MRMAKIIFENLSGVKDYKKIVKLYAEYEKARERTNQKKMQILSDEIKKEFADALEGLQRISKIYSDAENEIKENTPLYTTAQIKSFSQQAQEMLMQLQSIGSALGLTSNSG